MDVNLPEWLGVIGAFLSVALALGAGLALVKGSYNKARIAALREDNDDLRARVGDMAAELERRKLQEETLSARVSKVDSENQLLRDMVTQRAEVERVNNSLAEHHREAMASISDHHRASSQALEKVSKALTMLVERNQKP